MAKAIKKLETKVEEIKEVKEVVIPKIIPEGTQKEADVPSIEVPVVKLGIEESKDLFIFLAKLGASMAKCAIDKKFLFTEFIDDIQAAPAALYGITEIPAEMKDLDSEEVQALIAIILEELAPLGIATGDAAKLFIKAGISFIEGIMDLIKGFKATQAK